MDKPLAFFQVDAVNSNDDGELWVNVMGGASVCIKRTDEGIVIDVLAQSSECVASTYAFFAEMYDQSEENI
jgi:hypothetical protein